MVNPQLTKSKKPRWEDPPHHEFPDIKFYSIPKSTFGYFEVVHEGCGGLMSLVKLYVDCFPDDKRFKDFSRPDAIGASRIVLGMKCTRCGYVNSLKFILHDTRIFTLNGLQPRLKKESVQPMIED